MSTLMHGGEHVICQRLEYNDWKSLSGFSSTEGNFPSCRSRTPDNRCHINTYASLDLLFSVQYSNVQGSTLHNERSESCLIEDCRDDNCSEPMAVSSSEEGSIQRHKTKPAPSENAEKNEHQSDTSCIRGIDDVAWDFLTAIFKHQESCANRR